MKISAAVREYVGWRRELGYRYTSDARFLSSFSFHFGHYLLEDVRPSQISKFINRPTSALLTRNQNHGRLTRFFQYLERLGRLAKSPMPPKPPRYENTFVPYIYSRAEIRRLVSDRVLKNSAWRPLTAPETLRTLLLFLYGTGMSMNEATTLTWECVNFARSTLAVSRHDDVPKRVIPMGRDVRQLLLEYRDSLARAHITSSHVFISRAGNPLKRHNLMKDFHRIRREAGVFRPGGPWRQPRMHDLRYTFAVHRLTSWYRQGIDVQDMLPALAVYMGFHGLRPVQGCLLLTPEHFRKQLALKRQQSSLYGL